MNFFYDEIVDLATKNVETKIELERQKENDYHYKINTCIDNIYNSIINTMSYKNKITESASRGYNKCTIYEFDSSLKEEETQLLLLFIFKGPRIDNGNGRGLKYFYNINIKPLLHRLNNDFNPFKLNLYFNSKTQKYSLDAIW